MLGDLNLRVILKQMKRGESSLAPFRRDNLRRIPLHLSETGLFQSVNGRVNHLIDETGIMNAETAIALNQVVIPTGFNQVIR